MTFINQDINNIGKPCGKYCFICHCEYGRISKRLNLDGFFDKDEIRKTVFPKKTLEQELADKLRQRNESEQTEDNT